MDHACRLVKREWRPKVQEPPLQTKSSGQSDGSPTEYDAPSSSEEVAPSTGDGSTKPDDVHSVPVVPIVDLIEESYLVMENCQQENV